MIGLLAFQKRFVLTRLFTIIVSWFAVGDREACVGIEESIASIRALIQDEIELGIAPKRIIIGGFSQVR